MSYTYRGYTIYEDGVYYCYLGKNGTNRMDFVSDVEAEEYLDYIIDNNVSVESYKKDVNNLYDRFVKYCKNLPGKCFIDDKLCTYDGDALHRFVKPFEKSNECKIIVDRIFRGEEDFYCVVEIV